MIKISNKLNWNFKNSLYFVFSIFGSQRRSKFYCLVLNVIKTGYVQVKNWMQNHLCIWKVDAEEKGGKEMETFSRLFCFAELS